MTKKTGQLQNVEVVDNFILRGESYKNGMLLLLDSLDDSDWKLGNIFIAWKDLLKEKVETLYKNYLDTDKASTFEDRKNHFDDFLGEYQALLARHTTLDKPFKSLLIAERCSVWEKGREAFGTSVDLALDPAFLSRPLTVVQEETLGTDSELLFKEYEKLESEALPDWFKRLESRQQKFLKANWRYLVDKPIPSSLRWVPGLANLSLHSLSMGDDDEDSLLYFRHATPLPVDLALQKDADADNEAFRLTCLNLASQVRLSLGKKTNNRADSEADSEIVILIQSVLSPGRLATLKSQHVSDASDNDTYLYEMKERGVDLLQFALHNPDKEIEDNSFKSLFFSAKEQESTLYYKHLLEKWGLWTPDDPNHTEEQKKTRDTQNDACKNITVLSSNYPLNILGRLHEYPNQTKRNDHNTSRLLGAVARYLEKSLDDQSLLKTLRKCEEEGTLSDENKKDLIKALESLLEVKTGEGLGIDTVRLLDALQAFLSIPTGKSKGKRHPWSLASGLEIIIVHHIGGVPWLACKSGKDRTGVGSAAIDAAQTFYELYGKYPRYEDTKLSRGSYLEILNKLFASGHHQQVASQNAPGAKGLINPARSLPGDMEGLLDTPSVRLGTKWARLNKPREKKNSTHELPFYNRILEDWLDKLIEKVKTRSAGKSSVLLEWDRNWEVYYIGNVSVKALREGKVFESEQDLGDFIEEKLLYKIEDAALRKEYLEHVLYSFHQGGFPHIFSYVVSHSVATLYKGDKIYGAADFRVRFEALPNGVKIEEANVGRKVMTTDKGLEYAKNGGSFYQTHSSISVKISKGEKGETKNVLSTEVHYATIESEDKRLLSDFYKSWLELIIIDLVIAVVALLVFLKHLWEPAKEEVLSESTVPPITTTPTTPTTEAPSAENSSVVFHQSVQPPASPAPPKTTMSSGGLFPSRESFSSTSLDTSFRRPSTAEGPSI
jgi:hypothetical protein